MFREYKFSFDEVRPSNEVLMKYLQLPDAEGYTLVEDTVLNISSMLEDTQEIIGGYNIIGPAEIDVQETKVFCMGNTLQTGQKISRYMQGASRIALFICTAGERFTNLSHTYQEKGDFLEAFIVESIGSAIAEKAMDRIQCALEEEMRTKGYKITNRYSPGYCDWPLSDQQSLFSSIGTHTTGISLTPSCLMQPIKSVSGIIGIGENVKKRPYGCAICGSSTCVYRKILTQTTL